MVSKPVILSRRRRIPELSQREPSLRHASRFRLVEFGACSRANGMHAPVQNAGCLSF